MTPRYLSYSLILAFTLLFSSCKQPATNAPVTNTSVDQVAAASPSPSPTPPRPSGPIEYTDVTAEAGIRFKHNSGAFGKKYLPETIGSCAAFIDYDNDGWQDILIVNGKDWPESPKRRTTLSLYKNNRDGTFHEVTRQAGLNVAVYGMGVAVGDYDNDGHTDVFLTAVGGNRLFRSEGAGKFRDVTAEAGVGGTARLSLTHDSSSPSNKLAGDPRSVPARRRLA